MSLLKAAVERWFSKDHLRESDDFIIFMQVAMEDPVTRQPLTELLERPHDTRVAALNSWLENLNKESAPQAFSNGVHHLRHQDIADKALKLLKSTL